jgi:hypothetical protein
MNEYENGCPILEDEVLRDEEYMCPTCGRVCGSLTEYHKHAKREHPDRGMIKGVVIITSFVLLQLYWPSVVMWLITGKWPW